MISLAFTALTASVSFVIGVLVQRWFVCQHRFDDGTDRYEIVPYRVDSDKLGVNRKTVYRCMEEGCPAEKTVVSSIKVVDRDTFEAALDDITAYQQFG